MEKKGFSIGEMIQAGWRIFKDHVGFFIALLVVVFLIQVIPNGIAGYLQSRADLEHKNHFQLYAVAVSVIGFILSLIVSMGLIKVSLRVTNNEKPRFGDLFTAFPQIVKYFVAQVLYGLLMVAGLILLVFPMFIWGMRYLLVPYFIIDQKAGIIESFKLSGKITFGAKWDLLGLVIVSFFLNLLGVICILLGLFITIPVVMIAHAAVYRKLVAQTQVQEIAAKK